MTETYINKCFFALVVFSLVFVILLYKAIGFQYTDEICAMALFFLFFYALAKTSDWSFNKAFLFTLCVFLFYFFYSIWINSNTTRGIFNDLIIQMKPYLGFFCTYQLCPKFSKSQKRTLKSLSLILWFVFLLPIGLISIVNDRIFFIVMEHPVYFGIGVTIISLCYFFCSEYTWRTRIVFLLLLSLGLFCARSKFYGFFAMSFFVVVFFSNVQHFRLNFKNISLIVSMLVAVLFVAWEKIAFYFFDAIVGTSAIDEDMIARFMLYKNFPVILWDYFPFGSGFASYATYSSGEYYSKIYVEYGLDGVWGLSRSYHSFVSDTFYPSLAQFGVVGIILYLSFWGYILKKAYLYNKKSNNSRPQSLILVVLIVGFLAIEGTTASTFIAQGGFVIMMLLGLILSDMRGKEPICSKS